MPLTADGQIDLDAAEAMLTEEHRVVAFAHVSNVLGSILDAKRAAEIAHSKGALLLLDGCQAVPRMPVDVAAIGADFYAFSGAQALRPDRHRLPVGPRRAARSDAAVAGRRRDDRQGDVRGDDLSSTRRRGSRRERRTSSARSGCTRRSTGSRSYRLDAIHAHECALVAEARAALSRHRRRHALRPRGQRRDRQLQRRRGASARHRHHIGRCGRRGPRRPPLRAAADALCSASTATARASFAAHSDSSDIEALVRGIEQVKRIFGMNEERKIEIEEVDAVDPAAARPRHRREFERKRDYLAGFLAGEKPDEPNGGAGQRPAGGGGRGAEVDLRPRDPGRHLRARPDLRRRRSARMATRSITMTLTTPHCPVAESLPQRGRAARAVGARASATPRSTWSGIRRGTRRR